MGLSRAVWMRARGAAIRWRRTADAESKYFTSAKGSDVGGVDIRRSLKIAEWRCARISLRRESNGETLDADDDAGEELCCFTCSMSWACSRAMLSLGVAPLLPAAAEAVEGDLATSLTLFGVTPVESVTPDEQFNRKHM